MKVKWVDREGREIAQVEVRSGKSLLDLYENDATLPLKFGCRRGDCGICAIKLLKGKESVTQKSRQEAETLRRKHLSGDEYRLACQCALNGDVEISVDKPASC